MRTRVLVALATAVCVAGLPAVAGNPFTTRTSKTQRVDQALNRLTFGPRPGDAGEVRKLGPKKWIELQLHPEQIPENPLLERKLAPLDTLRMTNRELVEAYPPPQVLRAIAAGRVPYPADPVRRKAIEREVARYRQEAGEKPAQEPKAAVVLSAGERRTLRSGTPAEKLALIAGLPPERQDDLLAALPAGARLALYPVAPPQLRRRLEVVGAPRQVVVQDLMQAKLLRAVYSNRQLQEVLVDFWYNHFNVFLDKGADRYLVTGYERDAIRPHVLGHFSELLEATAKSPAMLFYLDNWQSTGPAAGGTRAAQRGLNENYGRELLELHSLGVDGGYTQKDVTEVARCFTGWTIRDLARGGEFSFNPRMHDTGEKTVLGVKIPAGGGVEDGMKVLDLVAHHPSTARFISRKLAQRFVADNPPPALVERMAAMFRKSDGDIRAVLRTMFTAREFWSAGAYRAKLKSPFEMVVSAVRAAGAEVDYAQGLANQVAQLGQPLYRKLEPTGYSNSGQEWMNSAGLLARMNFAVQLADNRMPGVKVEAKPEAGVSLGAPEFQRR